MEQKVTYKDVVFETSNHLTESAGKLLAEEFKNKGQAGVLKESFGITFSEAGMTTTTASGAYTTLLASTLYSAALDKIQDVLDLVEINEDLKNSSGGFGAIKVPRITPTIAVEVAEGAIVNYFNDGVTDITITCRKVVAGTRLTWEIVKRGMSGFASYVLKNAADAVSRKLAGDILNGLAAAAGHTTSGGLSYTNLVDTEAKVNDATYNNGVKFGFIADTIVFNPTSFATARKDSDIKLAMAYASQIPNVAQSGAILPVPLMIGNLKVVISPFLTSALALILEKKRNILIKENDLETFEGRIPGSVDNEVIAMMSYSLCALFPESVGKVTA